MVSITQIKEVHVAEMNHVEELNNILRVFQIDNKLEILHVSLPQFMMGVNDGNIERVVKYQVTCHIRPEANEV